MGPGGLNNEALDRLVCLIETSLARLGEPDVELAVPPVTMEGLLTKDGPWLLIGFKIKYLNIQLPYKFVYINKCFKLVQSMWGGKF